MQNNNTIPDHLENIYKLLICAFPDGISHEEYWSLLSILHPQMSFWNIADLLSVLAHKERIEVYNDASGFGTDSPPSTEEVEKVKQKLHDCGYEVK